MAFALDNIFEPGKAIDRLGAWTVGVNTVFIERLQCFKTNMVVGVAQE